MLDQQDRRAVAADVLEQAAQRGGLRRVHASGGLVEREELGLGRERARDLEAALVPVGQVPRQAVRAPGHAHVIEQLVRPLVDRPFLVARVRVARDRAPDAGARAHVAADHHVLQRRQVGEQPDVLERAGDSARGDLVGLQALQHVAVEREVPAVGHVDAGEHVEQRRLAGAVRADQPVDLAVADREPDVGERLHAAEALRDALRRQQRQRLVHLAGTSSSRRRTADGRMPAGRNSIISTSASPNSSMRITSGSISMRPNSAICAGSTV